MRSHGAPTLGRRRLREQTESRHWTAYPDGVRCSAEGMVRWDTRHGQVENQAIVLALYLLMPLDELRRQLSPSGAPDLDALGSRADRYGVALSAAALKRPSFTERQRRSRGCACPSSLTVALSSRVASFGSTDSTTS